MDDPGLGTDTAEGRLAGDPASGRDTSGRRFTSKESMFLRILRIAAVDARSVKRPRPEIAHMRMPERLFVTSHLSEAFVVAHRLANDLGHQEVTAGHLTLGMLHHGYNMVAQLLLNGYQVPQETLQRELEASLPPATTRRPVEGSIAWSASDERILALAAAEAHDIGHDHYGCQHVLLAFLRDPASPLAILLGRYGATFDTVRRDILRIYSSTMEWPGTGTHTP